MAKYVPLGQLPPTPAQAAATAPSQAAPPVAGGPARPTHPFAYVRTVENVRAFVRYARTLKANGQQVSAYSLAYASTPAQRAYAAQYKGAAYVAHNHATGATVAFATWAPCYAYTMGNGSTALAPSVVGSLGKQGLAAVPLQGLTVRPPAASPQAPCHPCAHGSAQAHTCGAVA